MSYEEEKKPQIVAVEWLDTARYANLYPEKAAIKECVPKYLCSVGFLLSKDGDKVLIASEVTLKDKKYKEIMAIPFRNVKTIVYMDPTKDRIETF
jgi:hypothetical protein